MVLLDQSHSMFFGSQLNFKSVTAAETAAMISWATLQHGDRIGGVIFNEQDLTEIRPKRANKSLMHLFSQTESMNRALSIDSMPGIMPEGFFARALRHARRVAHPGTHIFIISDFSHMDDEASRNLRQLAKHCQLMALQIIDPLEQALPGRIVIPLPMAVIAILLIHGTKRCVRNSGNNISPKTNSWQKH